MMIIKKSILVLLGVYVLCILSHSQTFSNKNTPLILITENQYLFVNFRHQPINSVDDIHQISNSLQKLKAISITTENVDKLVNQLKEIIKSLSINKEQISSLIIDQSDLKNLPGTTFQNVLDAQSLQSAIQQKGQNLLIQINQKKRQPRKLIDSSQTLILTNDEPTPKKSLLFLNMNSITLTGLLVSLFLVVILMVAIKCLYDVKTNDQFGRTNLWVGKES